MKNNKTFTGDILMKVTLRIDGNCGVHSKEVELPNEIIGMHSIVVNGITYMLFTTYDVERKEITALATHFFAKDEDVIDLSDWVWEEGGFTEARAEIAKLMKEWE